MPVTTQALGTIAALALAVGLTASPVAADARPAAVPASAVPVHAAPAESALPGDAVPDPEDWKPDEPVGLTGPVSEVLADAPERGPVRVVTLTADSAGRPEIDVTVAEDRAEAADAVRDARAVPDVLAVVIDAKSAAADAPRPVTAGDPPAAKAAGAVSGAAAQVNDTHRKLQWALNRLHGETAWTAATGTGQIVAVVDSGVDASTRTWPERSCPVPTWSRAAATGAPTRTGTAPTSPASSPRRRATAAGSPVLRTARRSCRSAYWTPTDTA
ncbi:hypothetical protein [Planomonospora algeriensis]